MRKKGVAPLVTFVGIIVLLFAGTLAWDNKPSLGLDLQGGVSVVLQPVKNGQKQSNVSSEALEQTKEIIDTRVNAIGVGEPDITIQGSTVVVQLPGIKDQQRVLELVGKTAELNFRPVIEAPVSAPPADAEDQIKRLRSKLKIPNGVTAAQIVADETAKATPTTTTTPGATTTPTTAAGATPTTAAPTTTAKAGDASTTISPTAAAPSTTAASGAGTGGGRSLKGRTHRAAAAQGSTTTQAPTTTAKPATTTTAKAGSGATTTTAGGATTTTAKPAKEPPKNQWGIDISNADFGTLYQLENEVETAKQALTPAGSDDPTKPITVLGRPDENGARSLYKLGPVLLTGRAIETATASISQNGQWTVNPTFKDGKDGIDLFNAAAAKCFANDPVCPVTGQNDQHGRLAVVLDSVVVSGPPVIQAASFARDQVQISGSFKEQDARDLALALRYGSLPLTLVPQQVQTVSATLGSGALHAGLLAGAIGLALVCIYIVAYYRLLGLMTVCELCLTAMTLWVIIAYFGEHQGLTLTLAGIVGIVVSIGVSLDSSVVFFEHVKEDVRNGRTLRATVERSFGQSFRTVVKADLSSLIGAIILYLLSVGPVRGFAFYLGLSTLIDLGTSYFFMKHAVTLLATSRLGQRPSVFGIPLDSRLRSASDDPPPSATPATANEGGALA